MLIAHFILSLETSYRRATRDTTLLVTLKVSDKRNTFTGS